MTRQRAGELRLPHPGGPQEEERPDRPPGILQPGPGPADRIAHSLDGLVLSDDPLVQPIFHLEELTHLPFQQPADRDPGPLADDLSDIFRVDLFL